MLSVDRKIANDDITTFITAVCLMFGSYYCFNIHYPSELASVLEFLQRYVKTPRRGGSLYMWLHFQIFNVVFFSRCFFVINPEKGTKVAEKKNKKRVPVNPRVFTLISDLSDHEWRETL